MVHLPFKLRVSYAFMTIFDKDAPHFKPQPRRNCAPEGGQLDAGPNLSLPAPALMHAQHTK
jgi:hypothetical protein